jgi:cytochrome c-type biogenesis protein CcmH
VIGLLLVALWLATSPAFADDALDARLKSLESQLRCLVCQNQTLAESNAPLAEDLRKEVRELAVAGKSDDDIRAYLVARYGDFVLYKPPVKATTYALWFGPFVLLAAGIAVWLTVLRRRARMPADDAPDDEPPPMNAAAASRARALLDE